MKVSILGYTITIERNERQLTIQEELCQVHPSNWSEPTCQYAIDKVAALAKYFTDHDWDSPTHMLIPRIKALRSFAAQHGWVNDNYISLKEAKDWVDNHTHLFPK